jgi:hypothetical protein
MIGFMASEKILSGNDHTTPLPNIIPIYSGHHVPILY